MFWLSNCYIFRHSNFTSKGNFLFFVFLDVNRTINVVLLFSSICIKRKYWFRGNFIRLFFHGFAYFKMSKLGFVYFWTMEFFPIVNSISCISHSYFLHLCLTHSNIAEKCLWFRFVYLSVCLWSSKLVHAQIHSDFYAVYICAWCLTWHVSVSNMMYVAQSRKIPKISPFQNISTMFSNFGI